LNGSEARDEIEGVPHRPAAMRLECGAASVIVVVSPTIM